MITNLFSIFDPSTPNFRQSNWLSILLIFIFFPSGFWVISNRAKTTFSQLITFVSSEFKPLVKSSPVILIIPISAFTFIIINNIPGLFPYTFTASRHIIFSLSLALPIWMGLNIHRWFINTSNTLAHLVPPSTPAVLSPFIVLIETVRNLIRPITLSVRLAANMIAGHLLISLLRRASPITPLLLSPLLSIAQLSLTSLEVAVALIQGYVFAVLITLYRRERIS